MPPPSPRSGIFGATVAALVIIAFCLLLLAHDPLVFWNDDYQISVLPVFADMARAWNHFDFPLLSPYSWVCANLAGEFQYGVFSIFINSVIVCVWKLPLAFSQQAAAVSILHLAVLGAGAFVLARGRQLSIPLSIFVALVAALNGWSICWGASDWFGALGAFAWLPWAWWAAERAMQPERSRWSFLWAVPFVYLLITGGFPYTVLMLGLVLTWLALRNLSHLTRIGLLCLAVSLGAGLAAPAWLALLEYVHGSARESLHPSAHWQWLVPWKAWPGLLLPFWTVNWLNFSSKLTPHCAAELACGLVAPAALLAGVLVNTRPLLKKIGWELALLLVVVVLAMLPTAGVFRWSFRWLPLLHLVLALCAAEALTALSETRRGFAPLLLLLLILLFGLVSIVAKTAGPYVFPLTWIFFVLALGWLLIESLGPRPARDWCPAAVTFLALLVTYFCIPPNCGVPKYNLTQSLLDPRPLDVRRLYLSVYPPPENFYRVETKSGPVGQTVRLGSTSMWAAVRLVNGYSPIRPAGVAREFVSAVHGEVDANLAEWLLAHQADSDGLLARLGIDGIIVGKEFNFSPQPTGEWQIVVENDEGRVFHRHGEPIPVVRSVNFSGTNAIAKVSDIVTGRNSVSALVELPEGKDPALIAFSRPFFPGYRAQINGHELAVVSERNLMPLVEIAPGTNGRLTLSYRPSWLIYGGITAFASAIIWIVWLIFAVCASRRLRY